MLAHNTDTSKTATSVSKKILQPSPPAPGLAPPITRTMARVDSNYRKLAQRAVDHNANVSQMREQIREDFTVTNSPPNPVDPLLPSLPLARLPSLLPAQGCPHIRLPDRRPLFDMHRNAASNRIGIVCELVIPLSTGLSGHLRTRSVCARASRIPAPLPDPRRSQLPASDTLAIVNNARQRITAHLSVWG